MLVYRMIINALGLFTFLTLIFSLGHYHPPIVIYTLDCKKTANAFTINDETQRLYGYK